MQVVSLEIVSEKLTFGQKNQLDIVTFDQAIGLHGASSGPKISRVNYLIGD